MPQKHTFLLGFFVLAIALIACDGRTVYKDNVDFEDGKWFEKSMPTFNFTIANHRQPYNLYFNIRNGQPYPYYNLYVTRFLYDSTGKKLISKLLNNQILLFDAKTGKPLGSGLGDMYDHKIAFAKDFRFPYSGKYTLKIQQQMRQNPLAEIISMGLTIENVE